MRVLQLHTAYREAGGEDVAVAEEARVLAAAGHAVDQRILTNPTGAGPTVAALAAAPWNPGTARHLRRHLATAAPDVAAVHNTWFAMSPSVVSVLGAAGVPVVMTLHNYRLLCPAGTLFHHGGRCHECVGSHPWHAVSHRCYRDSAALSAVAAATVETWRRSGALDAVTRFVVMTEAGRSVFEQGGLPPERIVVRPHGIDDPGPPMSRPSASDTLVYAGRAVEEKGVAELVRWWGRRPRPWRLDVIGDGPALEAFAGHVPHGVRLRGALPRREVLEAMRSARAVVVPSLWDEPFGLVAVEAMSCGVGVLSTGVGGLADIHGADGGWLAGVQDRGGRTVLDDRAWDAVIARLDDAEVDRAGEAARTRYEARYTREAAASSLLAVYEGVVGSRSA